jgi:S1-C subfamily serine protease
MNKSTNVAKDRLESDIRFANNIESNEAAAMLLDHEDARMDRRLRALTTLGWWAVAMAVVMMTMCCTPRNVRNFKQEHETSVRITVVCFDAAKGMAYQGYGSGVMTSAHTLLTARHVASKEATEHGCIYSASTADGVGVLALVNREWKEHDVAELVTLEPMPYTPIKIGHVPHPGEDACVVASYPVWWRKCGAVQYYRDEPPGDIGFDVIVEPGNSGSGVYDSKGRLVGITTHLRNCQNGQWCGGKFSSLEFML